MSEKKKKIIVNHAKFKPIQPKGAKSKNLGLLLKMPKKSLKGKNRALLVIMPKKEQYKKGKT